MKAFLESTALIYLAYKTDSTRIATYQIGRENGVGQSDYLARAVGFNLSHALSHETKKENGWKNFGIYCQFLNEEFGPLKYIGRELKLIVFPSEYVFPENVYFLYYANNEKFTRLVEYKKFTKHKSDTTLIGLEIPSKNGKHYPLPLKKEIKKSHKYLKKFPNWFFSIGRAGTYRYEVDIDDCIEQAMNIKERILNKPVNFKESFEQLKNLNGENHKLITATTCVKDSKKVWSYVSVQDMLMRKLSDNYIKRHGNRDWLRKQYKLDDNSIINKLKKI